MRDGNYSLRYISKFEEDLSEIVDYITFKLHNPVSAINLVKKIENAIVERLASPLAFQQFPSNRKRKNPYYRIYVGNFTVYYVVIRDVMEVRRVLYNGRNV
ncbi:plasmid stabilization system protein [Peptococcaceae bacterium CEB3]|nr:plasmid stabilization system protein [Peptococcaceae bacterium CEB3]